jgi:ABC-type uncharacterized transport system involved in gliding motility auxiliary subunit
LGVLIGLYGLVFLIFTFVALLAGAGLYWIYLQLGLAVLLLGYAAATSMGQLRERLTRGSSRRAARFGGNVIAQTAITAAILAGIAYLSVRNPVRWDWTEAGVHSLAQATVDVLEQVPGETSVEVLAFFAAGSEAPAKQVLDRYQYRSDRIKVRYVNPNAQPTLAKRFEIAANGVMIVCAGPCEQSASTARVLDPTEEELTKAIRSVISSRRKVYVLEGHGEASPDDTGASGLSQATKALENENIAVEPLLLMSQEHVPEDADAVVIAGPDRSLLERELDGLGRYLDGGGALLVMVDPIVVTNLEERLGEWGFKLGSDVIVDEQIQLFAGPQLGVQPVVTTYDDGHAITKDMQGRPTIFQLARSVRPASEEASVSELALTGTASWAETDLQRFLDDNTVKRDANDLRGPVSLAAARTLDVDQNGGAKARVVVIGDSDFARNRYVSEVYNADLFVNVITWLVGEESFITIDRKLPRASVAVMTTDQFHNFRYLSIFIAPQLILLIGIGVWWRRRT